MGHCTAKRPCRHTVTTMPATTTALVSDHFLPGHEISDGLYLEKPIQRVFLNKYTSLNLAVGKAGGGVRERERGRTFKPMIVSAAQAMKITDKS